ncbi:DNA polymerase III subunit delta' [Patescibacteria group bacterium]|nr:DNA polymerase III subunit delta' [Patescibacteria group bacterium]
MENAVKTTSQDNWGVIGHQRAVAILARHIETDKINHAYLFVGPESVGKRKVATEFARTLFCLQARKPCGQCRNCLDVAANKQADVNLVTKTKGKIGIAQVREVQHHLSLKSYQGGYRVCIIDGVDCFTLPAANAILKILEEPGDKVVFILLAESIEGVIPTIISRSVIINFNLVAKAEIEKNLAMDKSSVILTEIAQVAFGRPGLAIKYQADSEQLSRQQQRQQELLQVLDQDINSSFQMINSWKVKNEQALEFINAMTKYFRDLIVSQAHCPELALTQSNQVATKKFSRQQIRNILNYLVTASKLLTHNVNPKLVIENFIVMLHHDQV